MKTNFILLILAVSIQSFAIAQDVEKCEALSEIQSFMLMENKITFHSEQIDFESIEIVLCTATEETYITPKILVSADEKKMTINFSECIIGTYIISGSRGEILLDYSVELKPTH